MGARTTTAGKVKIGLALDPRAYELLQEMASGPRGLGTFLEDLICAEAARRGAACTSGAGAENAPLREAEAGQREELARRVEELQAVSERLQEAEAEARDLVRYAPTAFYEIDFRTGRFLSVNDAMCEMLGYSREELLAMSAFEIMDEANRTRLAERQRLALAGEHVDPAFEYEVRRKDGAVVYGSLNTRIIYRDGLPVSAHVIAHDVTERRRAADEQRAQQERLARLAAEQAAVLEAIADGLVIYDELGQITRMNRAAERILALSLGDRRPMAGEVAGRLGARLPDGRLYPPAQYPSKRALQGETVQGDVMILHRPDAAVWIASSAAPILGPDGRPRGAVATFADITSLHETQEHLEETYLELEAAHEELQAQAEELARANAGLAEERDHLQALEKELRGQREQSERLAAELEAILSAIADGLVVYDSQGRITRMNALAEDVLGFSPEMRELPYDRRVPSAVVGLHADGTPYTVHEYPSMRALHGEVVRHQELIMQLPGRPVEASWVSVSSGPIHREDGSIGGAVTTFTDVSRVHRLNEQLSRANTDLEAILAAVPSGLIVYDAAGRTLRASQAALRMVGWSSDSWHRPASERAGANIWLLDLKGQYLPKDRYPALRALRGESLSGEEYYVHFPDGPEHDLWAVFSAGPIRKEDGQVVGALITWADTGKLHEANLQLSQANAQLEVQAEQLRHAGDFLEERVRERTAALQESEQRFLTAFNLNPTALAISSMEGRYVEVNRTFCDLLGYSRAELIGKTSRELGIVAPPTHRKTLETIATSGGGQPYEIDARAQDGRVLNFMCYVQTVSLQGVPHYIVANVDITERKRAEALIAAHIERLAEQAELLDLSHDGIFVRGLDGVIQFWNRGAAEMYGWTPDEANGRISHELLRTEFPQPMAEIMTEVIERDRWEGELRHTTRGGASLWVASRWALKRDERGQPAAILEINNDISAQKAAEAQRAAAQQAILEQSQRLELLHEQLQASHAQLAQREAMLTTLARRLVERQESERSYVADRLYNEAAQVIAALKMQVGVMERSAKQEPPTSQRLHDLADMMDRALVELHRLATDLRPAVLDRLGLAAAVQQYAAEFAARHALAVQVEARDLKGVRLPAEVETGAYRVLQEALANAAQHAHASHVAIALDRGAGRLRLQVTDDGIGFDVREAEARGSVGLAGMRERAEAVRGALTLASAPGSGTKVTLEIPEPSAVRQP